MLSILPLFYQKDTILIGRHPQCDLTINDDTSVSRRHCEITRLPDGRFVVKDLNSSNGTFVNDQRISTQLVNAYDTIQLGRSTIFQIDPTAEPPKLPSTPVTEPVDRGLVNTLLGNMDNSHEPPPISTQPPIFEPEIEPVSKTNTFDVDSNDFQPPSSPAPIDDVVDIFCIYHDSDEEVCQSINRYLTALKRNDNLNISIKGQFSFHAGTDIAKEAEKEIADAEIILLFVSADFIHSEELYKQSTQIIKQYNEGKVHIVPIITKFCLWDLTPFAKLSVLPKNQQPIKSKKHWPNPEEALTEVSKGVYNIVKGYSKAKTDHLMSGEVLAASDYLKSAAAKMQALGQSFEMPKTQIKLNTDWQFTYQLKQFGRRWLANVVDTLIAYFCAGFFAAFVFDFDLQYMEWEGLSNLIIIIIYMVGFTIMESSKWQATPGKKVMGLQISDSDGERISWGKSFIRILTKNLFLLPVYIDVYFLGLFFVSFYGAYYFYKKEFLHDTITKTIVSYRHKS